MYLCNVLIEEIKLFENFVFLWLHDSLLLGLCVCMCVPLFSTGMQIPIESRRGHWSWVRLIGSYEPPDVGAGNWIFFLWKVSRRSQSLGHFYWHRYRFFFQTIIRLTEKLSRKSRNSHFFLLPIMPFLLLIHLLSVACFQTYNIALIAIVYTVFCSWYYTLYLSQRKL